MKTEETFSLSEQQNKTFLKSIEAKAVPATAEALSHSHSHSLSPTRTYSSLKPSFYIYHNANGNIHLLLLLVLGDCISDGHLFRFGSKVRVLSGHDLPRMR